MKLIINADDYGLSRGVNLGIIDAFQRGLVRSTTFMTDMDGEAHAVELAKQNPDLKIGIHLRLTAGRTLADNVPSLEDPNNPGFMQPQSLFWDNQNMKADEIERELRAQIEHFLALGLTLSHFDGHHHCHRHPLVLPIVLKLAAEYDVPMRPATDLDEYNGLQFGFSDQFYGDNIQPQSLIDIVKAYQSKADVLEVMCHPAYVDQPLLAASSYAIARTEELVTLTDTALAETLSQMGVEITDYRCFKGE